MEKPTLMAQSKSSDPYLYHRGVQFSMTDDDYLAKRRMLRDPSTSPDAIAALSLDMDSVIRWDVAQHIRTPPDVLARLSYDVFATVLHAVASNPSTPPETLVYMAQDRIEDANIQFNVAENPSTPYGIWISDLGRSLP